MAICSVDALSFVSPDSIVFAGIAGTIYGGQSRHIYATKERHQGGGRSLNSKVLCGDSEEIKAV